MKDLIRHRLTRLGTKPLLVTVVTLSGMLALAAGPKRVELTSGSQDPAPPYVTLDPDNIDFGNQVVRRMSAPKSVLVRNTGGQPLNFDMVAIEGDNPNSFSINKDSCTGATVDPGKSCVIQVNFTPTATGGRNARLRLTNNAANGPQIVKLKGNGINAMDVAPF